MVKKQECFSDSETTTQKFAKKLSSLAKRGDVFALYGTLGVGKSVFAREFIKTLTGETEVPSPTFTIVQTYDAQDFEIYHFDMYRLKSPEEVFELNFEEAVGEGVCLIEWPEKIGGYIPSKAIKIYIEHTQNGRKISIEFATQEQEDRFLSVWEK